MKLDYLASGSDDCPLIRLQSTDPGDFAQLFEAVRQLQSSDEKVRIDALPMIQAINGCSLTLGVGARKPGIYRISKTNPQAFEWIEPRHRWENVEGLIEPFMQPGTGHQWLCGNNAPGMLGDSEITVLITSHKDGGW